jgi:hypothetical protein
MRLVIIVARQAAVAPRLEINFNLEKNFNIL